MALTLLAWSALAPRISHAQTPLTCHDVQFTTDASGNSPHMNEVILVRGIVTAAGMDGDKFFIGDSGGGAWSGLYVFRTTATPAIALGDLVDVRDSLKEFFNNTELSYRSTSGSITVISHGSPVPPSTGLTTTRMNTEEQWEGVLVQLNQPMVVTAVYADTLGHDTLFSVNDGSGECMVKVNGKYAYVPTVGDSVRSLTGCCNYSHNRYHLEPRGDADILRGGSGPIPPTISSVTISPAAPSAGNAMTISATVTDDRSVASVRAIVTIGTAAPETLSPSGTSGSVYSFSVPGQPDGTSIHYYVLATDDQGASTVSPSGAPANQLTVSVGTPADVIPIATVQQDPSRYVAGTKIRGYVTIGWQPGDTRLSAYIQDHSGRGINVYGGTGSAYAPLFQRNAYLEVTGKAIDYVPAGDSTSINTEFENLTAVTVLDSIPSASSLPVPVLLSMTAAQDTTWDGTLVSVYGTVTRVSPFASGIGFSGTLTGADGTVSIYSPSAAISAESLKVGQDYTITGVWARYSNAGEIIIGYQDGIHAGQPYVSVPESVTLVVPARVIVPATHDSLPILVGTKSAGHATLTVYTMAGQPITTLLDEYLGSGTNQQGRLLQFDGRDRTGEVLPNGPYLLSLRIAFVDGTTTYRQQPIVIGSRLKH